MRKDRFAPGEPCWADCGTDVAVAVPFYASLFGWQIQDLGADAGGYHMAMKGDAAVAGLGPSPREDTHAWNVYVRVDDAARTADKVLHAGGTVVAEPMQVLAAGWLAVFDDPTGARFSIWQPNEMAGFAEVNSAGTYCWAELSTADPEAATGFYADVFGWSAHASEDGAMPYTEFQLGVTSVAGMMAAPDGVASSWGVYFAVDDCDETVAAATALGATTVAGPMDLPVGRLAACVDPVGAAFSVIAMQPMGA